MPSACETKNTVEFSQQSSPLPSPLPLHRGYSNQELPPSPPTPSSRRHRLTDTSSLHRRYSHRRIATNTPPLFQSSISPPTSRPVPPKRIRSQPSSRQVPLQSAEVPPSLPSFPIRFSTMPKRKKRPTTAQMQKPVVKELGRQRLPLAAPNQRNKSSRAEVPPHPRRPRRNEEGPPHRVLVTLPVRRHLLHRVLNS